MSFEIALSIALLMLAGNAFFVGAEFGLISARRSSIELKALRGSKAAKITLNAMENISLMLAGAQLGITICSLVLGAVGEPLFAHLLEAPLYALGLSESLIHPVAFILALSTMVYLHVVIGEMVPKNLALANPDKTTILLTPPLVFIVKITRPIVVLLNAIANKTLELVGIKTTKEVASAFTRDEVAGFVEESKREGLLSEDEGELLSNALGLHEKTVTVAMLPTNKLICINYQSTPAEVEKLSAKTGYSRFPILNEQSVPTHYIHLKDILGISNSEHKSPIPKAVMRPLAKISGRATMRTALAIMQRSGTHLASVTDRNSKVIGIIALEDLLEEFVGEIRDDSKIIAKNKQQNDVNLNT